MYGWWTIVSSRGECNHDIQWSPPLLPLLADSVLVCTEWAPGTPKTALRLMLFCGSYNEDQSTIEISHDAACCLTLATVTHISTHLVTPTLAFCPGQYACRKCRPAWLATRCWCKIVLRSVIPSLQNNKVKRLFWPLRQLERFSASLSILPAPITFPSLGTKLVPPWQLATGPLIIPPFLLSSSHALYQHYE